MSGWRIVYTEAYNERARRFLKRHPELREQYRKTLELLETNPAHPGLRLHRLHGRLEGLHSVSINLAWRITLEFIVQETSIIPMAVGSHDEVY